MAMRVFRFRYDAAVTPERFRAVLEALRVAGHRFLIASANKAYLSALEIDSTIPDVNPPPAHLFYREGDLIAAPDWSEIAYIALREESGMHTFLRTLSKHSQRKNYLECGAVVMGCESKFLEGLQGTISRILSDTIGRALLPEAGWSPLPWQNKKFEKLLTEHASETPEFGEEETRAVSSLREKRLRDLVKVIKAARAKGLTVPEFEHEGGTQGDLESLISAGLLQQSVEGIITSSDLAKFLLDHSRWMSALLVHEAKAIGVTKDRILLECRQGSNEIDAFLDIDGTLLMVELKDKEFSMGNAKALSEDVRMYEPAHVLIVATERISQEVRSHFERYKPKACMTYADSVEQLGTQLAAVANIIGNANALAVLEQFDTLTPPAEISRLLMAKIGLSPERKGMNPMVARTILKDVYEQAHG